MKKILTIFLFILFFSVFYYSGEVFQTLLIRIFPEVTINTYEEMIVDYKFICSISLAFSIIAPMIINDFNIKVNKKMASDFLIILLIGIFFSFIKWVLLIIEFKKAKKESEFFNTSLSANIYNSNIEYYFLTGVIIGYIVLLIFYDKTQPNIIEEVS